ncbi:hypothetical protein [Roseovarius pacificus]|uniref:hypothetical protein n=1 Tax=Roseovarius pacificus TaxID=337701 RepID=UPI0037495E01
MTRHSLTEHAGTVKPDPGALAGGDLLDAPGIFQRFLSWFDSWLTNGRKTPLAFWLVLFALPGLLVWVKLIAGWVR